MKKLKLDSSAKTVYDIEHISKPSLLLKGIGNYCKCGCGRHVFSTPGMKKKHFFNSSCRRKHYEEIQPRVKKGDIPKYKLVASISLNKIEDSTPHYNLSVYPIKGHKLTVPITSDMTKLWNMCESFAKYRVNQNSFPLEIKA